MNRLDMAGQIIAWEARRDKDGKLRVYDLPSNDGGGSFEVAGINERYDGPMARRLRKLVESGKHAEAEKLAIEYIAENTDKAATWVKHPALEFFMRDCVFNRGATGAAKILQIALRTKPDGRIGPITKAALADQERFPALLLAQLRRARETYENIVAPGRANLRKGMINRWDKSFAFASKAILDSVDVSAVA